jgi:hypothetical protein
MSTGAEETTLLGANTRQQPVKAHVGIGAMIAEILRLPTNILNILKDFSSKLGLLLAFFNNFVAYYT